MVRRRRRALGALLGALDARHRGMRGAALAGGDDDVDVRDEVHAAFLMADPFPDDLSQQEASPRRRRGRLQSPRVETCFRSRPEKGWPASWSSWSTTDRSSSK